MNFDIHDFGIYDILDENWKSYSPPEGVIAIATSHYSLEWEINGNPILNYGPSRSNISNCIVIHFTLLRAERCSYDNRPPPRWLAVSKSKWRYLPNLYKKENIHLKTLSRKKHLFFCIRRLIYITDAQNFSTSPV